MRPQQEMSEHQRRECHRETEGPKMTYDARRKVMQEDKKITNATTEKNYDNTGMRKRGKTTTNY